MEDDPIKRIFKHSNMPAVPALVCMILAMVFMIMDQQVATFRKIHSDLSLLVLPIQYLVNWPIKTIHWAATSVTTQQDLLGDNARLRAHELLLEAKMQKLLALERENAQLRELLQSSSHIGGQVKVAQLLAVSLNPSLQEIVVDQGGNHKIYSGQPVLDAYGVVGQVVQVGPLTSKVMLITNPKCAVPVQNYRNGIRAIAIGTGTMAKLELINVLDTADIKVGDLFVSSGLAMRYPVGYPVGRVLEVQHQPGRRFATVYLEPSAHLDQSQQLLMVWPEKADLANSVQQQLKTPLPE